jgi:hypothetical protein
MIHSKAFKALPTLVKNRVFFYLADALSAKAKHAELGHLSSRERKMIRLILEETSELKPEGE